MVVSLDAPSGFDVTTGATPDAVVRADATLTLALPKVGMRDADVIDALYLAAAYGSPAPDFCRGSILKII